MLCSLPDRCILFDSHYSAKPMQFGSFQSVHVHAYTVQVVIWCLYLFKNRSPQTCNSTFFCHQQSTKTLLLCDLLSSLLLFTQQAQGRCVCAGDFVPAVNLTSDNDNQSWLVPLLIGIAGCVCLSAVIALIVWQVTSNAAKHNKTALHVTNKYYKACLPCHIDVIHHLFSFGAVLWNRH